MRGPPGNRGEHMIAVAGIVVVIVSVLGGFVLEGGPVGILIQPVELLIIGGAAAGTLIIGAPKHHLIGLAGALKKLVTGSGGAGKPAYLDLLRLQYELFVNARKAGFIALERDINDPHSSSIISKYPTFLGNHHAVGFMADSMRLLVDGAVTPMDLDHLLDSQMETHHDEASKPAQILAKVGDTLPGLGIVAAVLGIVISMSHIDGPPEVMGHKVAVALVGTFMGVLFAYGFVNPLAVGLEMATEKDLNYLACIKAGVVAFAKGSPPPIAVEFARRAIYDNDRPSLAEVEAATQAVTPR
jgi:chemotaxis protein MotA